MTDTSDSTDSIDREAVITVVSELVALERDRTLGYAPDELHTDPRDVIEEALVLLDDLDTDPDEVVFPEDQDRLGISSPSE
ncbi:hypothetical protein RYH80_18295 [Halobaculum sp. MBLA0147]|uniref:hypothetical protein n=1 Tax=Halobaculum sp. MBLA0147 TaxID=3079934 RepID=UPI0035246003